MNDRVFIFQHGWGFDRNFWQNLVPYFKNEQCIFLDSGYFGENINLPKLSSNCSYIGIGHSLGFGKLLLSQIKFAYLIGLNSFLNFLGKDSKFSSQRKRELFYSKQHLLQDHCLTLHNFYRRCNMPMIMNDKFYNADVNLLYQDLNLLTVNFLPPNKIPILILNSQHDLIMPKVLSLAEFDNYANITLDILDINHHGLGYFNSELIYKKTMSFINANAQTKNCR